MNTPNKISAVGINSNEMDIVRKQTISSVARAMYSGEIPMPKTNAEYKELIQIVIDPNKNSGNMFSGCVSAQVLFPAGNNMLHTISHTLSPTEVEKCASYGEAVCLAIKEVTRQAESILDFASAEAHQMFRENLFVFPLFVLAVRKTEIAKTCDWLRDNTKMHEAILATIYGTAEYSTDPHAAFYRVSHASAEALSNTNYTAMLAHAYNFTPIIRFCLSFKRSDIPTQEQVLAYHKHKALCERF